MKKINLIGLGPNSNNIKKYKNSIASLSQIQFDSAIGLMLGDASLHTQNNGKTYRMKFEWTKKNSEYVMHVYNLFDNLTLSLPHLKKRLSPKGNEVITLGFQTLNHKAFNPLADLFLNDQKQKRIKENLILQHLNERGLSYWFSLPLVFNKERPRVDDGGKLDYNLNSKNKSLVLNTQSFNQIEVKKMANDLTSKFNLLSFRFR